MLRTPISQELISHAFLTILNPSNRLQGGTLIDYEGTLRLLEVAQVPKDKVRMRNKFCVLLLCVCDSNGKHMSTLFTFPSCLDHTSNFIALHPTHKSSSSSITPPLVSSNYS